MVKQTKVTIEEFLAEFNWEIREIIDNISGEIFQQFPNIKEKISNSKIIYKDSELSNFLELKANQDTVTITNLKKNNKESKKFKTPKEIDLEKLKIFFNIN